MKLMKTLMIAGALMVSAQAAVADNATVRLSTIVSYDDLDLNLVKDADVLYSRLWRAARNVCVVPTTRDLQSKQDFNRCRGHAIADAIADIDNPNLSQQYFARTGKQAPVMSVAALR